MKNWFQKIVNLTQTFRLLASSVFMLLAFLMISCGSKNEKQYRIGMSQCSGDSWRERVNLDVQLELLNHPDVELSIRNADNDSRRQIEDVKYFIDNNYDLIILAPNEAQPLVEVVEEAKKHGIPVVTFDRMINSDSYTAHMEVDNKALGAGVVKYVKSLGDKKWNILEIRGPESASPAQLRHVGFVEGVAHTSNMVIKDSVFGEWDNYRSKILTDSIIKLHPEINMVFAHTDHMASGAYEALHEAGRDDVVVIGIDGFADQGIKFVQEGKLTATFLYPTEGQRLLQLALAVLKGEPYDRIMRVAPLSPIDASNADILLSQDTLLNNETSKILLLNDRIDQQLERYTTQKTLLWAFIVIVILMCGFVFILLRSINANRQHQQQLEQKQAELEQKNIQLSEEKEKQEHLYTQLNEATRSKLLFFTNVSHDLRTPLTLIAGPVEQVVEDPTLSPRSRELMKLTKKNVGILRRLIDQILDFRKYENGKSDLKLTEVDFGSLVREWTETFREAARKHDLTLRTEVEKDAVGQTTAIDVEKMERVFFNLMSNAFKHTPDNGKITVTVKRQGESMAYSVKDTGCGIGADELRLIFDNFYQAEGSNPRGSGIGLALTKAFVELHGGEITVESEKGEGSMFTVTFPIRHTDKAGTVQSHISREEIENELSPINVAPDTDNTEKPTLLVIDDNTDIRTLIEGQLGTEYNVISANDGLQGLRAATKYVPDIILCDVMMPVMDGLECVKALKEEVSTSHIPVLMLTACALDEQRVAGYEHGADAYLSKPFNLNVLAARCRNLLANRKLIRELYVNNGRRRTDEKSDSAKLTDKKAKPAPVDKSQRPRFRPNDVESEFYTRFINIIESRLSDPDIQISEIASEMGLGQSQFTRKIKALTNYTPVELIRNLRVHKAKTMLLNSEKSVSEIAFALGFSSLAYFSKCYKDAFGVSPKETREGMSK